MFGAENVRKYQHKYFSLKSTVHVFTLLWVSECRRTCRCQIFSVTLPTVFITCNLFGELQRLFGSIIKS